MKTTLLVTLIPALLLGASLQISTSAAAGESDAPAAAPGVNGPAPTPAPPTGLFPSPAPPSALPTPEAPPPVPPPGGFGGGGMVGMGGGMMGMGGGVSGGYGAVSLVRFGDAGTPALIVTQPMAAEARAEWLEDLRVMDKLLREAISRVGGEGPREAMGIPLLLSGRPEGQPIYVEDFGALFSYAVNSPLATAEKAAPKKTEKQTGSAWDRAKKEIEGAQNGTYRPGTAPQAGPTAEQQAAFARRYGINFPGASAAPPRSAAEIYRQRYGLASPAPPPGGAIVEFDPAKVDALVDAVLAVLPEARNIRHLQESECVVVTVAGTDDTGAPVRLTFKVRKADIDAAASGKLTPEEFKKRVARNLG